MISDLLLTMSEPTSIPLTKEIRDRLRTYGQKGETYGDILTKLMDIYDEKNGD